MKTDPNEQPKLSRRRFAQVVVGGTVVVGFDPSIGRWVTRAQADAGAAGGSFDALPPLRGTLRTDDEARDTYSRDYGDLVHARPRAVLSPESVDDIVAIVKFARRNGLRIAARGQGHQPFGQALVKDGIVIDLRSLRTVHSIAQDSADVDAGATWRSLLAASIGQGRTPPVLTNYLELTIGGTLSIGGVGITSRHHGAQVDRVDAVQVVTGTGELLWCSEREHADLFHAALAGQGQCAILTRVLMRLAPAQPMIREYMLQYRDLATLLDDQRALLHDTRFAGLVALLLRTPAGWLHALQAVRAFTPPERPDDAALTQDLRGALKTEDVAYETYMNRTQYTPTPGAHPDLGLLLPGPAAADFVRETLPRLTATDLGEALGMRVFQWNRSVFRQPLFRLPAADSCAYIALLRAPSTDPAAAARAVAGNRALFERARELGGTLYPFAALALTRSEWQRHYGDAWQSLMAAKRRYDPSDVFASGPDLGTR